MAPLTTNKDLKVPMYNVTFEPGCRNNWHSHTGGQILIAVGGAGIYAMTLAERGFVTIAFDESYNGESSGEPRHLSSPEIFTEDLSAGVDFLGTRPFVDRSRIGVIGICGSSAFAISAVQVDKRIKPILRFV